ncbi:MAG: GH116 family glycosyl-hydrolase, partial [Candidatus Hinthialibacter sp.]
MQFRSYLYVTFFLLCFSPVNAAEKNSAVLGGIGTGKIEIDSQGRLGGITINHNPHQPINDPAGCFAAIAVESENQTIVKRLYQDESNAGAVKTARVKFLYPFAGTAYEDPELPVNVRLRAFSPVTPGDVDHSCFPAVVFEYTVENPGKKDLPVTLAMSWRNLLGLEGGVKDQIDHTGILRHKIFRSGGYAGILLQLSEPDAGGAAHNALGEQALVYRPSDGEKTALLPLWHPESDPVPFRMFLEKPDDFLHMKDGEFTRHQSSAPRPAAAAAARKIIP